MATNSLHSVGNVLLREKPLAPDHPQAICLTSNSKLAPIVSGGSLGGIEILLPQPGTSGGFCKVEVHNLRLTIKPKFRSDPTLTMVIEAVNVLNKILKTPNVTKKLSIHTGARGILQAVVKLTERDAGVIVMISQLTGSMQTYPGTRVILEDYLIGTLSSPKSHNDDHVFIKALIFAKSLLVSEFLQKACFYQRKKFFFLQKASS